MPKKRIAGADEWVDLDDAPDLTEDFFDNAEVFQGDTFIRRGPCRPRLEASKEQISVRLDPDVLTKLREAGPGWQSQINALLRRSLGLDRAVGAPLLTRTVEDFYTEVAGKLASEKVFESGRHADPALIEQTIKSVFAALAGTPPLNEDAPVTRKKSARRSVERSAGRPASAPAKR
jgi:uncharacterized protein (DUF4415 family)